MSIPCNGRLYVLLAANAELETSSGVVLSGCVRVAKAILVIVLRQRAIHLERLFFIFLHAIAVFDALSETNLSVVIALI